jgi:fructokinase
MNLMRLGIDLGGTKIEIIALTDAGEVVYRQRLATPQGDYSATLQVIKRLVEMAKSELLASGFTDDCSIGIGIPGALSLKTGLIKNANSTCLNGQAMQQDIEKLLGQAVRINNDANCMTVSEATDGAAEHAHVVFGVIIGTGTGGGVAINKQVITGMNAIAGEWGHNNMPWQTDEDGEPVSCYCGKQNCIETFLSGPGMLRRYQMQGGNINSVQSLIQIAKRGDSTAEQFMLQYEDWLARGLASIINVLDPEVIVLAGGLSNIERLYKNVPDRWQQYVFSDQVNTELVQARHGDSSGVRGAAWLWPANPGRGKTI